MDGNKAAAALGRIRRQIGRRRGHARWAMSSGSPVSPPAPWVWTSPSAASCPGAGSSAESSGRNHPGPPGVAEMPRNRARTRYCRHRRARSQALCRPWASNVDDLLQMPAGGHAAAGYSALLSGARSSAFDDHLSDHLKSILRPRSKAGSGDARLGYRHHNVPGTAKIIAISDASTVIFFMLIRIKIGVAFDGHSGNATEDSP